MRNNIHIYGRGIVTPRLNTERTRLSLHDSDGTVCAGVLLAKAKTLEQAVHRTIDQIVNAHFSGAPWAFIPK